MAKKQIHWALFDKDWNYRGGVLLDEGKKVTADENPEGHTPKQVDRFPQHYETWDPKNESWTQDIRLKHKMDRRVEALEGSRLGRLDIPNEATQRWFYVAITRLFPDLQVPKEAVEELFPLIDPERPPRKLLRPKSEWRRP